MSSNYMGRSAALVALAMGCCMWFLSQAAQAAAKDSAKAPVREYWIAAEKASWNYAPHGKNLIKPDAGLGVWGETLAYPKYRYIGYTDGSYAKALPQPAWMGILGPQLRAVVGETIKVHFLNKTDRPLSMHPHGVFYDKHNEGADGAGAGASVAPGKSYTYTWVADEAAGPGPADPSSVAWLYHSHVMEDEEANLGLVGTIVVTRKGMARSASDPAPRDVDQEFTSLFMIFNEEDGKESGMKHTVNGRIFGNLEGYETSLENGSGGMSPRWVTKRITIQLTGMGKPCLSVAAGPMWWKCCPPSMTSVDMTPRSAGNWLFHCHVDDHMMAGMSTRWRVAP